MGQKFYDSQVLSGPFWGYQGAPAAGIFDNKTDPKPTFGVFAFL